jgi:hypothetical protein
MARIFLSENDYQTIDASNSGVSVFGSLSADTVQLNNGVSNVTLNANVDVLKFSGNLASYQFSMQGNQLQVWLNSALMATVGIQTDTDGTELIFADVDKYVTLVGMGQANIGAYSLTSTTSKTLSTDLVNNGFENVIPLITLTGSQTQDLRSVQHVLSSGDYQVKFDVQNSATQFVLNLASPVLTSSSSQTSGKQTILNFGSDDSLQVKSGQVMSISSSGSDVTIGVLSSGSIDSVTLVGVNTAHAVVNSVATFNALAVGDITLI